MENLKNLNIIKARFTILETGKQCQSISIIKLNLLEMKLKLRENIHIKTLLSLS